MPRFIPGFCLMAGCLVIVPNGFAQGAPAAGTLKEKIVFVRMDPSVGIISMRSITDTDTGSGSVTGRHAAPDMNVSSRNNHLKDELEVMNPDGSGITPLHVFGSDPMFSPDGKKIVYCSVQEAIYSQIYVMDADGKNSRKLTDVKTGDACGPAWSSDGKRIAYYAFANTHPSRDPQIWVMDADGSNARKLIDHGMDPSWSPDGKQIAFASRHDGLFQIFSMNADGSNVRQLTKGNAETSNPAWSPAGNAIAYIAASTDDRRALFVMNPDGSEPQRLIFSKHQDFCFPSWSVDGKVILISSLNRTGPQGIVPEEEKPRCEQWSGEYQIFAVDNELKTKLLADTKVMGTRPSYGRILVP